jgi:hypothetical protein
MTKYTQNTMRKVKRKLDKIIKLHVVACGYEENLHQAWDAEAELLVFLETEFEKLTHPQGTP